VLWVMKSQYFCAMAIREDLYAADTLTPSNYSWYVPYGFAKLDMFVVEEDE